MNCGLSHQYGIGLDATAPGHINFSEALQALRNWYIVGRSTAALGAEVDNLADGFDHLMHNAGCEGGGGSSIAAKPKCVFRAIEIFDSDRDFVEHPCERIA